MEGLIIFIVISLLSYLFKGKQEQQQKPQKPMPPFSNKRTPAEPSRSAQPTKPTRSLDDFAKDIFAKLEQQAEPSVKEARQSMEERIEQKAEQAAQAVQAAQAAQQDVAPARPKMAAERPLVAQMKAENELAFNVVPQSREALMQAVVMAEILGPPKARKGAIK